MDSDGVPTVTCQRQMADAGPSSWTHWKPHSRHWCVGEDGPAALARGRAKPWWPPQAPQVRCSDSGRRRLLKAFVVPSIIIAI
jgi:hypothetical protein